MTTEHNVLIAVSIGLIILTIILIRNAKLNRSKRIDQSKRTNYGGTSENVKPNNDQQ